MHRLTHWVALIVALNGLAPEAAYAESIPLKPVGGTFVVPVIVNEKITLDFLLDSGATEVAIPLDVFSTLLRTDTVSVSDLLSPGEYVLADGSVHRQPRFRIRSLRVGSLELHDVVASVGPAQGSLLLGQSFLARVRTWSVDNQRHVLLINEIATEPPRRDPVPVESALTDRVTAQEKYDRCVMLVGASQCTELQRRL